jgi:two-component system sensor histidine kinase RpfC
MPPDPAGSEDYRLDPAALKRLRDLGGTSFVREMIGLFLDYAPTKLAEARVAHQAGNLAALAKAVHPLRSSAGNLGAGALQTLASRIEQLAAAGQPDPLPELLGRLETAFAGARTQLLHARDTLSA